MWSYHEYLVPDVSQGTHFLNDRSVDQVAVVDHALGFAFKAFKGVG